MKLRQFVLLVASLSTLAGCSADPAKWEYHTLRVPATTLVPEITGDADKLLSKRFELSANQLNALGLDGWELVGVVPEVETVHPNYGSSEYVTGLQPNVRSAAATLLFKRPMTKEAEAASSASPSPAK